jgi:hypothetical protein
MGASSRNRLPIDTPRAFIVCHPDLGIEKARCDREYGHRSNAFEICKYENDQVALTLPTATMTIKMLVPDSKAAKMINQRRDLEPREPRLSSMRMQ